MLRQNNFQEKGADEADTIFERAGRSKDVERMTISQALKSIAVCTTIAVQKRSCPRPRRAYAADNIAHGYFRDHHAKIKQILDSDFPMAQAV